MIRSNFIKNKLKVMNNPLIIDIQSTFLKKIGYQPQSQELLIVHTPEERYVYPNITQKVYEDFLSADSKEDYYNEFLKDQTRVKLASDTKDSKFSILEMDTKQCDFIGVERYEERAEKSGRLFFASFSTSIRWSEGDSINGEIKKSAADKIVSIDFSFPKKKLYDYLPETEEMVNDFIQFNNKIGTQVIPSKNDDRLTLASLSQKIADIPGVDVLLFLPNWILTDSTRNGQLDLNKVHDFDPNATEMNLNGFARAYKERYQENRDEADIETIEWADFVSHKGGWI